MLTQNVGQVSGNSSKIPVYEDAVYERGTMKYISQMTGQETPEEIADGVIQAINMEIEIANAVLPKTGRIRSLKSLPPYVIALLLDKLQIIRNVCTTNMKSPSDADLLLCIYIKDGPDRGIYASNGRKIRELVYSLNRGLSKRGFEEVLNYLQTFAPIVYVTVDPDLIPLENGIFNYKMKQLVDYTPDYVFLSKSAVGYYGKVKNPVIVMPDGMFWDIESWMKELSDDPAVVDLLWQMIGSVFRPNVHFDKAIFLYSEVGNNGKGTLCELMRNLIGKDHCSGLQISDFDKEFRLADLIGKLAIIADENDVGTYIEKAANFKSVVTGDSLMINRKFQTAVNFYFYGRVIQCVNELPRTKDKSDSFTRRLLLIPFHKSFTGVERKYIKHEYMSRKDVLEYVVYKVLVDMPDYYEFDEPDACKALLSEYKSYNDPIRDFWNEMKDEFVWDLLQYEFLYDLYKAWLEKNNPKGSTVAKRMFCMTLNGIVNVEQNTWNVPNYPVRVRQLMKDPETLIAEYNLTEWMNPGYHGTDINKLCMPDLKGTYRGLVRY